LVFKISIIGIFSILLCFSSKAQKIIVDSASTNKYIISSNQKKAPAADVEKTEELSFGDRALSIGKGILNRLKARLNLEEAAESIKDKKEKLLGDKEEEEQKKEGGT